MQSLGKNKNLGKSKVLAESLGKKSGPKNTQKFFQDLAKTFGQDFRPRLWGTDFFHPPRLCSPTDFFQDFNITPFFYSKKDSFSRIGPRLLQ
jgi:hypothetical protein